MPRRRPTEPAVLPLEPLEHYLAVRTNRIPHEHNPTASYVSERLMHDGVTAKWCGVTRRTVQRWKSEGGVPAWKADFICGRLREHPTSIWGQAYYDVVDANTGNIVRDLADVG